MKNQNMSRYNYQRTMPRLAALLKDKKPRTISQAAADLGLTESPVYVAAKKLRAEGKIHVSEWKMSPVNNRFIAVWIIGGGEDAPKPSRDEWVRPGSSEDEHSRRIAEELARPAFRHWQDVAFFGEARAA